MTARSAAPLVALVALVLGLGLVTLLGGEPDAPARPPVVPVTAPPAAELAPAALEPPRAGPAPSAPEDGARREGRALIARVVDATSGAPIPAARVAARGLETRGVFTGETDGAGRASFADVGPGALEVIAVAEGWLLPEPTPVAAGAGEVVVRLVAGVPAQGQVVLAPGLPGALPARVEVRLVGASARFVGGFEPTFTDAEGRFVVPGVPPEAGLALVASAPGWAEARLDLPSPVTGPLDGLRLELRRLLITGAVLAEGVARGDDLVVTVRSDGAERGEGPEARVRADGRFEVTVPLPGDWLVRAEQRGAATPWERVRVLDGAPPPDVQLTLRRQTTITGRVLTPSGAPAPQALVTARPTRGGHTISVEGDGEGAFTVHAVPGERYVLRASAPAYAPAWQGVEAPATDVVLQLGVGARVEATPFVGPTGEPMAGRALGCDPAGDGHVDEHHGEGAPAEPFEVELDDEGRPRLDVLPPGRWSLHVLEQGPGPDGAGELRGWVVEVEARPGESVPLGLDASGPRAPVRGVVRGVPGGGFVQVELRPAETADGSFSFVAACAAGADGEFTFDAVPPGRYHVLAAWDDAATGAPVEARGQVEVTAGTPAWVELAP